MTASLNRRRALSGVATAGIGIPLLAACGGEDSSSATDPSGSSGSSGGATSSSGSATSAPSETESAAGGEEGEAPADALASTADIEVGGGTIFTAEQVVVTQPSSGEFKCFSAVCTHQGCIVTSVSDGQIHCRCHGSAFSIEDGSNVVGPNNSPAGSVAALPEQQITVDGDSIVLG